MKIKVILSCLLLVLCTKNISAQLQTKQLITPIDSVSSKIFISDNSRYSYNLFHGNEFYADLRQHSLGFFCKAEEKRWKETKVQFKMRVGTLMQANQYERP